jgi:hypothetical protein
MKILLTILIYEAIKTVLWFAWQKYKLRIRKAIDALQQWG